MKVIGTFSCCVILLSVSTVVAADKPGKASMATPMKVMRYAQQLVQQYDDDGDGQLNEVEWARMQGTPKLADRNRDGAITPGEMSDHIARYGRRRRIRLMPAPETESAAFGSLLKPQEGTKRDRLARPSSLADQDLPRNAPALRPATKSSKADDAKGQRLKFVVPTSRLPKGLPSWFRIRDRDGDAQLSLVEFAPDGLASDVEEYLRYDLNGDGMVTAQEALRASQMPVPRSKADDEAEMEELPEDVGEEADDADVEDPVSPIVKGSKQSAADRAELKKAQRAQRVRPDKPKSG